MIGSSCIKKTNPTSNPLDPDTDEYDPPIVSIASSIVSGSVVDDFGFQSYLVMNLLPV